ELNVVSEDAFNRAAKELNLSADVVTAIRGETITLRDGGRYIVIRGLVRATATPAEGPKIMIVDPQNQALFRRLAKELGLEEDRDYLIKSFEELQDKLYRDSGVGRETSSEETPTTGRQTLPRSDATLSGSEFLVQSETNSRGSREPILLACNDPVLIAQLLVQANEDTVNRNEIEIRNKLSVLYEKRQKGSIRDSNSLTNEEVQWLINGLDSKSSDNRRFALDILRHLEWWRGVSPSGSTPLPLAKAVINLILTEKEKMVLEGAWEVFGELSSDSLVSALREKIDIPDPAEFLMTAYLTRENPQQRMTAIEALGLIGHDNQKVITLLKEELVNNIISNTQYEPLISRIAMALSKVYGRDTTMELLFDKFFSEESEKNKRVWFELITRQAIDLYSNEDIAALFRSGMDRRTKAMLTLIHFSNLDSYYSQVLSNTWLDREDDIAKDRYRQRARDIIWKKPIKENLWVLNELGDLEKTILLSKIGQMNSIYSRRNSAQASGDELHYVILRELANSVQIPNQAYYEAFLDIVDSIGLRDFHGEYDEKEVARFIKRVGGTHSVDLLVDILDDKEPRFRSKAALILGEIGNSQVTPVLEKILKDEEWSVRRDVAKALGQIGDRSSVPALISALEDKISDVRTAVVEALGKIGDIRAISALKGVLDNPEEHSWVREEAQRAIIKIQGKDKDSSRRGELNSPKQVMVASADPMMGFRLLAQSQSERETPADRDMSLDELLQDNGTPLRIRGIEGVDGQDVILKAVPDFADLREAEVNIDNRRSEVQLYDSETYEMLDITTARIYGTGTPQELLGEGAQGFYDSVIKPANETRERQGKPAVSLNDFLKADVRLRQDLHGVSEAIYIIGTPGTTLQGEVLFEKLLGRVVQVIGGEFVDGKFRAGVTTISPVTIDGNKFSYPDVRRIEPIGENNLGLDKDVLVIKENGEIVAIVNIGFEIDRALVAEGARWGYQVVPQDITANGRQYPAGWAIYAEYKDLPQGGNFVQVPKGRLSNGMEARLRVISHAWGYGEGEFAAFLSRFKPGTVFDYRTKGLVIYGVKAAWAAVAEASEWIRKGNAELARMSYEPGIVRYTYKGEDRIDAAMYTGRPLWRIVGNRMTFYDPMARDENGKPYEHPVLTIDLRTGEEVYRYAFDKKFDLGRNKVYPVLQMLDPQTGEMLRGLVLDVRSGDIKARIYGNFERIEVIIKDYRNASIGDVVSRTYAIVPASPYRLGAEESFAVYQGLLVTNEAPARRLPIFALFEAEDDPHRNHVDLDSFRNAHTPMITVVTDIATEDGEEWARIRRDRISGYTVEVIGDPNAEVGGIAGRTHKLTRINYGTYGIGDELFFSVRAGSFSTEGLEPAARALALFNIYEARQEAAYHQLGWDNFSNREAPFSGVVIDTQSRQGAEFGKVNYSRRLIDIIIKDYSDAAVGEKVSNAYELVMPLGTGEPYKSGAHKTFTIYEGKVTTNEPLPRQLPVFAIYKAGADVQTDKPIVTVVTDIETYQGLEWARVREE
ncbi:MAG: HEAT repeat domain-containing protein, partial [Candidatus Omnitrophota bacterium]